MGRKRIEDNEKKIRVSFSIKKILYKKLKENYADNISKPIEEFLETLFNEKNVK